MSKCNHPQCEAMRRYLVDEVLEKSGDWKTFEKGLERAFVDLLFNEVRDKRPLTRAFITETFHAAMQARDLAIEIMAERMKHATAEDLSLRGESSPAPAQR